jgi:hypothetical protein
MEDGTTSPSGELLIAVEGNTNWDKANKTWVAI